MTENRRPAKKSAVLVQTLTAEVRVLMIGSRQVTLSVFRQLDVVPYTTVDPFGRVNDRGEWIVGRRRGGTHAGTLTRAEVRFKWLLDGAGRTLMATDQSYKAKALSDDWEKFGGLGGNLEERELNGYWRVLRAHGYPSATIGEPELRAFLDAASGSFKDLPLIILAGLK